MFEASFSIIEQLPDTITRLRKLVKMIFLGCKKLNKLPEPLGKMQCLEELQASFTAMKELPKSIGFLGSLEVLELGWCKKLKYLPNTIQNLTSLKRLNLVNSVRIDHPETVKSMELESLNLRCYLRLWLPMIQSISSLKRLTLKDEGDSLSSTKPFSLSKLSNLESLHLADCTTIGPFLPELPINLRRLELVRHSTLEQLPDLSGFG